MKARGELPRVTCRLVGANRLWREWCARARSVDVSWDCESVRLQRWRGLVVLQATSQDWRRTVLREEQLAEWAEYVLTEVDSQDVIERPRSVARLLSWLRAVREAWVDDWRQIGRGEQLMITCYGNERPVFHGGIRAWVRRSRRHIWNVANMDQPCAMWAVGPRKARE